MQPDDAEPIRDLDQRAFQRYLSATTPPRSVAHIRACIDMNPNGCFVAGSDEPVGYLFSRVWGQVGWIGTFGVHPDHSAAGVGRALLAAGVESLRGAGCSVIGLETMPYSETNIGFYLKNGFRLHEPTLVLVKRANDGSSGRRDVTGAVAPFAGDLSVVAAISRAASADLDYRGDAASARTHGWGEVYHFGSDTDGAIAVVRTHPPRVYPRVKYLELTALATSTRSPTLLDQALAPLESLAAQRGHDGVQLSVHAAQAEALALLLGRGYRVHATLLRLQIPAAPRSLNGFDLSQWAM